MVGAGGLASLELSLAGSRHPWPRPPAAAPHSPDQKSISQQGQAAAAAAGEREPPELSIQSHHTFYRQDKFSLTASNCTGSSCVWCGWRHWSWPPAPAGSCALLQPRARGAGRRGAAASCGPGCWRQERRGDQKYLSERDGERWSRRGRGDIAPRSHQPGQQWTLIILHTFYNSGKMERRQYRHIYA